MSDQLEQLCKQVLEIATLLKEEVQQSRRLADQVLRLSENLSVITARLERLEK